MQSRDVSINPSSARLQPELIRLRQEKRALTKRNAQLERQLVTLRTMLQAEAINRPADAESLGERIKRLRSMAGLTQAQLGDRVGCHGTLVGMWERGGAAPDRARISKVARALCTTTERLLFGLTQPIRD